MGVVLAAAASHPSFVHSSLGLARGIFMFAIFGLVGLGSGGIKANVIKMGGDQFDISDPEEARQKDVCVVVAPPPRRSLCCGPRSVPWPTPHL
jgi:dipeptide/tripeptide permease